MRRAFTHPHWSPRNVLDLLTLKLGSVAELTKLGTASESDSIREHPAIYCVPVVDHGSPAHTPLTEQCARPPVYETAETGRRQQINGEVKVETLRF